MLRGGELGADMFLVNGKTHGAIPPIVVGEGEKVLLRLINAGHLAHPIHGHGHSFKLVATYGNPVPLGMEWVKDTFLVGPAERVDIEFDATNPGVWMFHCHIEHHMANGMMTVIQYEGHKPTGPAAETMDETITHGDHGSHGEDDPTPEATAAPTDEATAIAGDEVVVSLVDDRFDPYAIEVPAGTTVRWVNKGSDWHNVASSKAGFASDRIAPGESFAFTFEEPGTYKIVCRHHGLAGMTADVTDT
jgi:FtsP/CotA-like multicopper oxidase with cupredoxin domain